MENHRRIFNIIIYKWQSKNIINFGIKDISKNLTVNGNKK